MVEIVFNNDICLLSLQCDDSFVCLKLTNFLELVK